ncbi:transglycosylase SLT domain-containing protein, partial [Chloroflexota bacterium]
MSKHLPYHIRFFVIFVLMVTTLPNQLIIVHAQSPINEAASSLLVGDYSAAITQYSSALSEPALKCDALIGLGTTHLRSHQYAEADSVLTRFVDECAMPFHAFLLRGQARQQLGYPTQALEDYQQAIALLPGVLDSYLYEQMAMLNPDQGIYYLRLASEAPRALTSKVDLREKLADIYLVVGNTTQALAQYDLLLSEIDDYIATLSNIEGAEFDKSGSLRASIEYATAQIEIENDQLLAGYDRLQRIISNYPETSAALPALIDLILAGQSVDLLTRMRINVFNENYFPVVDVLTDYLADPATRATASRELFLLLGQAQRGMGNHEAAIETFRAVSDEFSDDPAASTALLELGQIYEQIEDTQQVLQTYTRLIDTYPQSPDIPQALLKLANANHRIGALENAMLSYRTLAQDYPEVEQTKQGIFEAAMIVVESDPPTAAELFGLSGTSKGLLWQGNTLHQLGNLDAAQTAWQRATAVEPATLFAIRACALLTDVDFFAPSVELRIEPITDEDRAIVEQWVAETFGIEDVSSSLSSNLANDAGLQRGTELWATGMWSDARAEFDMIHTLNRDNPAALLQLAFHYQTIHVYRSSLFAATRLIFASEQPHTQIPIAILRLAYPLHFADVVKPLADEYTLDPLLIASIVRQESSFDPTAQSSAGARGLMQLMPTTAMDIASRLELGDFTLHDLIRPIVNIELGSFYLSSMLSYQNNSVPGALLSYNAGPGNASAWLASAGDDLEQLYEAITFAESKLYLDLITENYAVYSYL